MTALPWVACLTSAVYILWLRFERRRLLDAIDRHNERTRKSMPRRDEDEVLWNAGGLPYICLGSACSVDPVTGR